ncbi:uncharacterized protein LOC135076500 isoform X1 [Ostrinia nubilalis]|uniref:uncharacterized protein LOC135076500 isoform X1 n=2 Tax=Ostrinia nubilalis TaxID=29057 RepID=UPI0030823ED6
MAIAVKPFTYLISIFGMKMIEYSNDEIIKVKAFSKLYSVSFVAAIISLTIFVKPVSWKYTQLDIPLNILTKSYGILHTAEALYSVLIVSFANSQNYVEMFGVLSKIDWHFGTSKKMFLTRRIMGVCLLILPIVQVLSTCYLRKFNIRNFGAHLSFFLIMLQGSIILLFILNIFMKHFVLNNLLLKKTSGAISEHKKILFERSFVSSVFKSMLREPVIVENSKKQYCWFELMQIYDKVADCVYIFNKIYSGQVFLMFTSWVICTLLIICRMLSPTVNFSEVIFSDIFMYTSINGRPIFMTKMCELFIEERKKTLEILINYLVHGNLDEAYRDQVLTMIDLVETRKLEITANVFTVNAPIVLGFCGQTISYAVIMIQYFYLYLFAE